MIPTINPGYAYSNARILVILSNKVKMCTLLMFSSYQRKQALAPKTCTLY